MSKMDHGPTADPERALAFSYAARAVRAALAALFALDGTLARVVRTTREPIVGRMRLTWWHAALCALDTAPPPTEPVLRALAREVLARGITGTRLAGMIDGWEALLDPDPLDRAALDDYAAGRGRLLFGIANEMLGASGDPVMQAGTGWALADLAMRSRDAAAATIPRALAVEMLEHAARCRWSRAARPLGALTHLARMDLALAPGTVPGIGSPRRVARLAFHRLTGR